MYWCSTHNREATHVDNKGNKCCNPDLAGITMPCSVLIKTNTKKEKKMTEEQANNPSFEEYQTKANSLALYLDGIDEEFPNLDPRVRRLIGISYASLGLGEVGEVQGKIKKIIRDSNGVIKEDARQAISKELGDVLWYVAAVCKEFGLEMGEVAQQNLDKLFSRKKRGVLKGSGDDR